MDLFVHEYKYTFEQLYCIWANYSDQTAVGHAKCWYSKVTSTTVQFDDIVLEGHALR